ncbi:hypothetical protein [Kribbella italica]|uniref:Uncharacterized protein n=1 Tax=Kribbella italica TaxID=1540520 RepID=A0A7W9J349_9ACTN|nr:hypothetical protein [Kribbella italica]MBB5834772.1 hypothetical protein [Kribbella italica]
MTTLAEMPLPTDRRVCVWFGKHLIADYTNAPDAAAGYEEAMRSRFPSLRVTNEPAAVTRDAELS